MVGLVIVSHLNSIAEGVCQMCQKLSAKDLIIIPAGGKADGSFGTDNKKICQAIKDADNGHDGVIVITDVGSAIISAGLALTALPFELAHRVKIADAPILEGAIAAAAKASENADVTAVLLAAENSKTIPKSTT